VERTKVLLLSSRLGGGGAQHVMALLARLNKDGRTIVLITHNPELGARTDRVIRLSHGHLEDASC